MKLLFALLSLVFVTILPGCRRCSRTQVSQREHGTVCRHRHHAGDCHSCKTCEAPEVSHHRKNPALNYDVDRDYLGEGVLD